MKTKDVLKEFEEKFKLSEISWMNKNYVSSIESFISNLVDEMEAEKQEAVKKVQQVLFDNVIEPNCSTCSNIMSNACDNGQVCMRKLMNGEFIDWYKKKVGR